nr:hypothetical protein WG33_0033 [uncultured bacterium]QMS47836.1 hypothetical protein WG33_0034 [uncultured bacterium]
MAVMFTLIVKMVMFKIIISKMLKTFCVLSNPKSGYNKSFQHRALRALDSL